MQTMPEKLFSGQEVTTSLFYRSSIHGKSTNMELLGVTKILCRFELCVGQEISKSNY